MKNALACAGSLLLGAVLAAGPAHAQSNEEAQRLVDEYAALESVCDVAKLRYRVIDRVVGRVRKDMLAQFDAWSSDDRRKFEDRCQRVQPSASRQIINVDRDIDVSAQMGRTERGTKILFERRDEHASMIGGACEVVVVQSGGDWMFVDGYCLSRPAPVSR